MASAARKAAPRFSAAAARARSPSAGSDAAARTAAASSSPEAIRTIAPLLLEMLGDVAEVFHVRTGNYRLAENRRLQDVVPALVGERSSHEHDSRVREQAAELSDGIEQQDVVRLGTRRRCGAPTQLRFIQ